MPLAVHPKPVSFAEFLDRVDGRERTLAVVNPAAPEQVLGMLGDAFADQSVEVTEEVLAGYEEDTVLLLEDDDVLAESPLSALADTILMVNSDLYITGTVGLDEFEMPDVLAELTDQRFSLRGYPESNSEKLLLILVSRHIERLASESEGGRLRSSFQRLSRIEDEVGTKAVYERLAETDTVPHVYGVPDWTPPHGFDLRMHGNYDDELRRTWFVLYRAPEESDGDDAALLAIETEPRVWDGFWTRDSEVVADLERYVERTY